MKRIISISVLLIAFHFSFSQKKLDDGRLGCWTLDTSMTKTIYTVIAGTSTNYNSLENLAKKISKKTEVTFENWLEYDNKRGMIVPDTSSNEINAGKYYPRRFKEKRISIEMMWYYTDEQNCDTLKDMIIITGIFEDKKEAEKQLETIQTVVPSAYIKKKGIYMGFMH